MTKIGATGDNKRNSPEARRVSEGKVRTSVDEERLSNRGEYSAGREAAERGSNRGRGPLSVEVLYSRNSSAERA